jgi:error-prone DNA polymerase
MPDRTVIQWEKDDLDPVRLVKIDLLGLGMLTLLQDCLKYVRLTRGVALDLGTLPMDDPAVYDMLCAADTIGVFQVESRAQQNTLPRLRPRSFYDLVVEVALIRPGPIQGDMVHPYLRRRAGVEAVTYPHPSLEPILARTLGIPLFQEQGMQVAIACAGFSAGEADELRRAMGHKRSRERMAELCKRLVAGMARNGIPEETAVRIYNQINAFADYGFPESHAASFALLVYASAYLKRHYAPEFTAALLNAQPMGFYSPGTIVEDARRHGVEVRPVDVTRSIWDHSLEVDGVLRLLPADGVMEVERLVPAGGADGAADGTTTSATDGCNARRDGGDRAADGRDRVVRGGPPAPAPVPPPAPPSAPALRLGLRSIRGLGAAARARLEAALADGPFASPADVVRRTRLDRRALRLLAEAGAFDAFFPALPAAERRRAALWAVLEAQRGAAGPLAPLAERPTPALPAMVPFELTAADYRLTALSLNGHPMRHLRDALAPNGVQTARALLAGRDGARAAMAGLVICRQRPGTAKGFVFLTLEDETGCLNVVVTPRRFERDALLVSTSPLLLVRGTLQVESAVVNLRARSFRALTPEVALHARSHDFR